MLLCEFVLYLSCDDFGLREAGSVIWTTYTPGEWANKTYSGTASSDCCNCVDETLIWVMFEKLGNSLWVQNIC